MNSDSISQKMYCIRSFAIYSVIMAHSCYSCIENKLDVYLLTRFSCFGVAAFFFISGYFFKDERIKKVFSKLIIRLLVPILFCGSLVYSIGIIRGQSFTLKSWINYLFGNGSYLYYGIVYFIIRLLLSLIPINNRKIRTTIASFLIILTIVSLEFTAFGLLPNYVSTDAWFFEYLNPYLNIFNWVGFVGIGIIFKEYRVFESIIRIKIVIKVLSVIVLLFPVIIGIFDDSYGYFGKISFVCESCLLMIVLILSTMLPIPNTSLLAAVGKNSFPIYLLHYPVLSLLCNLDLLRQSFLVALIRPFICIFILIMIFKISECILKKVNFEKVLYVLVGVIPNSLLFGK